MKLSETERIEILMMVGYGDLQRSHQDVCHLFNNVHPGRSPIVRSTVSKLVRKFRETGNVKDMPKSGRPKSVTNHDKVLDVLVSVMDNPITSTTQLALDNAISQSSVVRILKKNKQKPYKIHLLHELNEDDPDRRMQFCATMMEMIDDNPNFLNNILFSDEATFCLNGFVNRHNCRYWSSENPHWMMEHHTQYRQKLNVWAGIIGQHIIGPYFIDGNLNADRYLLLLRDHIVPDIVQLFPDADRQGMPNRDIWFHQDGAPPHYGVDVRLFLDNIFPRRWIGRRGPIEWPARSPDLSPLDFFLWGHLKTTIYKERVQNLEDLEARIRHEIAEIPPNWLQNSLHNFYDRLGYCQAALGIQFEHLI